MENGRPAGYIREWSVQIAFYMICSPWKQYTKRIGYVYNTG